MKVKIICAALLTAAAVSSVQAATPVDIMVNGNYVKTDTEPVMENGTVLAPIRAVANALGCESVKWNDAAKTAELVYGSKNIKISIGKSTAQVNDENKKLASPARLINNRTFVPVRFIAENFGADVFWNSRTHTVNITKDSHSVSSEYIDTSYTEHDLDWLAKIVHAEAQGEIADGKIGVANVVLNRVESKEFPNTIYDVIFDRKYGVQFTPIANGAIHNEPARESYSAAKKALKGANTVGESLYFCNPLISSNLWIMNNRPYYTSIGRHDFYL